MVSEIESDAWQLYSGFVHESSPSHIEFLAGVREDFRRAIDEKDLTLLEKATEEVCFSWLYLKISRRKKERLSFDKRFVL